MENKHSNTFDLPALLRMEDLNIRGVANKNQTLRTGEYFGLVANFVKHASLTTDTLNRISSLDATETDFRTIAISKTFLEKIGCKKFTPVINSIISAGKRGHNEFAADCARKILDDFNKLSAQILSAEKKEEEEPVTDDLGGDDPPHENYTESEAYKHQSLKNVLKQLEHEEATRKLRILAIDDAPVMLKTISSVLGEEYKVYGMTDPTMLEKFLRQITPDLFLLDYQMPERSGFDLIPIIRGFEEHKTTPIIFLTSFGTSDHVSAALTLGAADFVVKPFQDTILREKIAKHIVRKKLF